MPGAPVAAVTLGFAQHQVSAPREGFGYLVPSAEDCPVLGVLQAEQIYRGYRAPEGCCVMQVFMGGGRSPDLVHGEEEELIALALEELGSTLGVRGAPLVSQVTRHSSGIPQYVLGHQDRVARVEALAARHHGLRLCGSGLRGPGMDALVRDAVVTARAVADDLRGAGGAPLLCAASGS